MPDNVGYTPGSGATVAADDIGGVLYQRVKPVVGVDGSATDVSTTNPMPIAGYGELVEVLERIRIALNQLNLVYPDQFGRTRVVASSDGAFNVNNINTVTTVSTVSTVTAVTGADVNAFNYMRPHDNVSLPIQQLYASTLAANIVIS